MRSVAKRLDSLQLPPEIPHGAPQTLHSQKPDDTTKLPIPVFLDDFTITIVADSHSQLLPEVREALKAFFAGLSTHGMKANDSVGKTEIMISFDGLGSMAAAEALHSQTMFTITVEGARLHTLQVQVFHKYKHLGSYNAGHGRYELQSSVHTSQAWNVFKPL